MSGTELADLAGLGPYFAVAVHAPDAPPAPGWHAMAEIVERPPVLRARVTAVRKSLATGAGRPAQDVAERVAASVMHLGLVSRVLSPYLALTALYGSAPPVAGLAALRWQPGTGGPYPLSLPLPLWPAGPVRATTGTAQALTAGLLGDGGPVRELTAAVERLGVPPHILWGNVSSALHGAAGVVARGRPEHAAAVRGLAARLLASPRLSATGGYTERGAFRRSSCCLIYQAAGGPRGVSRRTGALCGDCVLRRPARPAGG